MEQQSGHGVQQQNFTYYEKPIKTKQSESPIAHVEIDGIKHNVYTGDVKPSENGVYLRGIHSPLVFSCWSKFNNSSWKSYEHSRSEAALRTQHSKYQHKLWAIPVSDDSIEESIKGTSTNELTPNDKESFASKSFFRNTVIHVTSKEMSWAVQKHLFGLGIYWIDGQYTPVHYESYDYLMIQDWDGELKIQCGNEQHPDWLISKVKPITVTSKIIVEFHKAPQIIEYNGKKYDKNEFENMLSKLNEM